MVRFTFGDQQSDIDHDFQVPLQRPTVDLGTQTFEALDSQAAVLKNVSEGLGLALRKIMLLDEHIVVAQRRAAFGASAWSASLGSIS